MADRQQIEAVLSRRFPGAPATHIAAAANALMALCKEWEEVARARAIHPCSPEVRRGIGDLAAAVSAERRPL